MTRSQQMILGATLAAAGIGGAVYFGNKYLRGRQASAAVTGLTITIAPAALQPSGAQQVTVTVRWQNATSQPQTYGVQGAILEQASQSGGIIGGHLFTNPSVAKQAESAFQSGNLSTVQQLVISPAARVVSTSAAPGSDDSTTLYGYIDPSLIVGPIEIVVWVKPGAAPGKLVVQDPAGMPVPRPAATPTFLAAEGVA